jgi:membrane protein YdbS with pleckstrin-like domain
MGYPEKLLNPGEHVAIDVRPHWKYLAGPIFAVVVVVAGSVVALVESVARWAELLLAALLLVCLVWLAARYIKWVTTSFVVTSERLVLRKGVFRRSGREILLDRLTDISYNQTLMDRLMGCGDILLESPGRDSQEVFPDLPHPVRIQNEIYRLINDRRPGASVAGTGDLGAAGPEPGGTPPVGPGTTGQYAQYGGSLPAGAPAGAPASTASPGEPTVAEQLTQLDDLRKRGVISRREFAAKKAELLSRM